MPLPEDQPAPKPPSELPSYSLDDADEPVGWRRWIRGWRLAVTLAVLAFLIGSAFGARPLYRELKARRALAIAEQAGAAIDRGESAEASTLLRQAALMAFQDERVADRVTFHAARAGDMASVAEIGKKMDAGEASAEEVLVFGERSLGAGRAADVSRALEYLPKDLPPDQDVKRTMIQAGLFATQQQPAQAESVLREALARVVAPESDELRVMLANLLLAGEDRSRVDEARQLLEQAAGGAGQNSLAALRVLAMSQAGLSPDAQQQLDATIIRLRAHPDCSAEDELFIVRLVLSSNPDRKDEAVQNLVTRLRERDATIDERATAARWLVGLQAHEAVLEVITPEEAASHAGALMVRLDALSGLNRWDECSELIETNRGGTVPDTLYHLFRARIAGTRNDAATEEAEKRQLRQVMQFAELPHVLFAARYAETVGWKPEAFAAWRILASDSGAKPDALRGQIRNFPPTATAADGVEISNQLLALQPQDPSARLSAAFFSLLAGENIEASAATAEEFLAADPESVDIRRVAALGRLRTGQAKEGLVILPDDNGEPRWQTLHTALLRAAGQTATADELAAKIDASTLTPEEKAMLEKK
jgi:hypothetical protein